MLPLAPTLPGFRGIRGDVLVAVKKSQPVTAKELAAEFGLTPNAVRRHLKELEAEGLIRSARQVRGVGGPTLAYSVTEAGEALFPRAYDTTLTTLLDGVRDQLGADGVVQLFRAQWERVASGAKEELAALPLNERAQLLAELLTSHGYMAEAGQAPRDEAVIREHNCVLRAVAERFPEVCVAEERFLSEFLGAVVERRKHIASGASCCEYCVKERRGLGTGD
jgi:DeoR family transcriptional regulator, suf operon transcriptional repressor